MSSGLNKSFNKLLRIFGLGVGPEARNIKVNLRNRIEFLLNLSCAFIVVAIGWTDPREGKEAIAGSSILSNVWHYQYQLEVAFVLALMVFNHIKQEHVRRFNEKVQEFDKLIASTNWILLKPPRSRTSRYLGPGLVVSSFLLLTMFACAVLCIFPSELLGALSLVRLFVVLAVTEFYQLISFQFIFGALCIYRRFLVLNMNVSLHLLHRESPRSQQNQNTIVRYVTNFHDILSDAIDEMNEIYSMEMVPVFLIALMTEVFIVYSTVKSFSLHLEIELIDILATLIWILFLVLPSYAVIYIGAMTSEEGQKLGKLFGKIANTCEYEDVRNRARVRPTIFTCGFFDINWKLCVSLFSTVTTYLIIICQFEHP